MRWLHHVFPHQPRPPVAQHLHSVNPNRWGIRSPTPAKESSRDKGNFDDYLGGDDQHPSGDEADAPLVERPNDVDDPDGVGGAIPECGPGVGEYRDQDVLLHVEGARVEGDEAEAGHAELGRRKRPRHEVPEREGGDLDGDLGDHKWLRPVSEELVEEGEQAAGDEAERPHPEGPHRERRVVGGRHRQANLLDRRGFLLLLLRHPRLQRRHSAAAHRSSDPEQGQHSVRKKANGFRKGGGG